MPSRSTSLTVSSALSASTRAPLLPLQRAKRQWALRTWLAAALLVVAAGSASAEDWRTPDTPSGFPAWADVEGFTVQVEPAITGRDEFVPIPVRLRAIEGNGQPGRTVALRICLSPRCDTVETIKLKTGTEAAPAPHVTRLFSLASGLQAVDHKGHEHTLLEPMLVGEGMRVALVGDEPQVFPAATVLMADGVSNLSASPGIAPLSTARALFDEPTLVHAFQIISIAPGTELPAPLVVELRRFLHTGHTVVGDSALRQAIVHMRDDTVTQEEAFSGARPIAREGRAIAPSSSATLVTAPTGQPLRVGARGPLPLIAFDEHGGLFIERAPSATGEDVIDAILTERPWLASGRMLQSRQPFGEPRGVAAAVVLVARTLPVWISWVFMASFALAIVLLVVRHRGRRSRKAFIIESAVVSAVLVAGILVTAQVRAKEATRGDVVVWSQRAGASLTHETHVRTARSSTTGDRVDIAAEPGHAHTGEVRGSPIETPIPVERLPDGGFAVSSTVDVALVVVGTGIMRLNGTLRATLDDMGSATTITNTTPFAFEEARVLVGHETKVAYRIAPGATVALTTWAYPNAPDDVDDRMVAAEKRLMAEITTRPSTMLREGAPAIVAVGHSGTRVFALEVMP